MRRFGACRQEPRTVNIRFWDVWGVEAAVLIASQAALYSRDGLCVRRQSERETYLYPAYSLPLPLSHITNYQEKILDLTFILLLVFIINHCPRYTASAKINAPSVSIPNAIPVRAIFP